MFFRCFQQKAAPVQKPPAGMGREDIATESSICTGETIIGFKDRATGRLLQAVVVRSPADVAEFYHSYGWDVPRQN